MAKFIKIGSELINTDNIVTVHKRDNRTSFRLNIYEKSPYTGFYEPVIFTQNVTFEDVLKALKWTEIKTQTEEKNNEKI